jgi:hypothetical protein
MDTVTFIGLGIVAGLGVSALAIVLLVVVAGAPIWAGLALLAVTDLLIIGFGYWTVVRSMRRNGTGL